MGRANSKRSSHQSSISLSKLGSSPRWCTQPFAGTSPRGIATAALILLAAGCSSNDKSLSTAAKVQKVTSLSLNASAATQALRAQVLLRASWGEATGQFGKRDQASRPGPMSLTVGDDGRIYVLDQVNRRVQRFEQSGERLSSIPLPSNAIDDIVVVKDAIWALGWQASKLELIQVDFDGAIVARGALHPSLTLPTGLFVRGSDIWLEVKHEWTYRVVENGRLTDPANLPPRVLGRPDRHRDDDRLRLTAARVGSHQAAIASKAQSGALKTVFQVTTNAPIVQLLELTTDQNGDLFLALATGQQNSDGRWSSFQRMMVVKRASGATAVAMLAPTMATDYFRPLAVAKDGTIYQLQTTEGGVVIHRFRLGDEEVTR